MGVHHFRRHPLELGEVPALVERAAAVFARHPEVISAYLFGSHARGTATEQSDLDFAVLRRRPAGGTSATWAAEWSDLHGELVRELEIGDDSIDLVLLDQVTDPLLMHRATWGGRLILCRDRAARILEETQILLNFLDTSHLRAIQREALRRAFPAGPGADHGH